MENQNIRIRLRGFDNSLLIAVLKISLILLKELEQKLKVQFLFQLDLKDLL